MRKISEKRIERLVDDLSETYLHYMRQPEPDYDRNPS